MRLREPLDLVLRDAFRRRRAAGWRASTPRRNGQEAVQEPAVERHVDRRRLGLRHRRRADAIVRQRHRDRRRCDGGPARAAARGAADDVRRAIVVARDGEIARLDLPQRGFARKELDARFLGGEARGEARRTARPFAGVRELLRREKSCARSSAASRRAAARCARSRPNRCRSGRRRERHPPLLRRERQAARTSSAALVPANPRQRIERDVAARRLRAATDTGTSGAVGIEVRQRRDARHDACARAPRARSPSRGCRPRRSGDRTPT